MADVYASDWETKLAWMRARSVMRATWDPSGALTSAEATPLPIEQEEEATQRTSSPIEQERRERLAQRRILTSGGPRPALAKL